MNLTPLEIATNITINTPLDIILDWEGTSKLIYCYKENKDLKEWGNLLSDKFVEECLDKDFFQLTDLLRADFLNIGLFLNCMKENNWSVSISHEKIIKIANQILSILITVESINREVKDKISEIDELISIKRVKDNKYDLNSYIIKANQQIRIGNS